MSFYYLSHIYRTNRASAKKFFSSLVPAEITSEVVQKYNNSKKTKKTKKTKKQEASTRFIIEHYDHLKTKQII